MKANLFTVIWVVFFIFPISIEARTLEEILKTKEIRICVSPIHPSVCSAEPEGCREDCRISGPVYEQVMAFVSYLGKDIEPKFISVGWDEQFFNADGMTIRDASYTPELLDSCKCDFYPNNLAKNEWRLKKLDFVTLFPNRMMVIVNKSQIAKFKSALDLAGKTAAIEKDTSYHTWMQEKNKAAYQANPILIRLVKTDQAFRMVDSEMIDFTMTDADAAIWAVRHQFQNTTLAFPVGTTDEIGWAFRKSDTDLQIAVKKFFNQQRASEDSAINEIWKKYFDMTLTRFIMLIGSMHAPQ